MEGSNAWWFLKGSSVWWSLKEEGETSFSSLLTFFPNTLI
jgi:hypothetical protein